MALFESVLTLAVVAIVLLQISRRFIVPYPTVLAIAGVGVAALPWSPEIRMDPELALALFIAPALLAAAYDLPPRELRRYWLPLLALAGVAVLLTTAAVAWTAVALTGMPVAAAVALGAIVAPPDAAAAAAMLARFKLPRRTVAVLKGESLLNDAVALLIFTVAVGFATTQDLRAHVPALVLAVPGGLVTGAVLGMIYVVVAPRLSGTLGGVLFQFVMTFAAWVVAARLVVSSILSVVVFAIIVARHAPRVQSARDRVHSYAVWETTVFMLNVLAFLLLGLQARAILAQLEPAQLREASGFAAAVLAVVVGVRVLWVLLCDRIASFIAAARGARRPGGLPQALLVSWCGMRGLVTLAIALALPATFPARDLIVLSAFVVVLGTLIIQGLTLGPLIRLLRIREDDSFERALSAARESLLEAALASLGPRGDEAARLVRADYHAERTLTREGDYPHAATDAAHLRLQTIDAQRDRLVELRHEDRIRDDVFHALEQELDWAELAASPPRRIEIVEG